MDKSKDTRNKIREAIMREVDGLKMKKSYNPCDDCKYGIERRNGSGEDSMCCICEFKAMSNAIDNSIKILQTVDCVGGM